MNQWTVEIWIGSQALNTAVTAQTERLTEKKMEQ